MAEKDVGELFEQLRASHGSGRIRIQDLVDNMQNELAARSEARKMDLWHALAGSELPHMLQSKTVTEQALQNRNPKLRMAALLLLCHHWPRGAELSEKCERLAFNDSDVQVRAMAVAEIGS